MDSANHKVILGEGDHTAIEFGYICQRQNNPTPLFLFMYCIWVLLLPQCYFLPGFAYIGFCTSDWNPLLVFLVALSYITSMTSEDQVSCIPGWFRWAPHSDLKVPVIKIIVKTETRNSILPPPFLDPTTKRVLQGLSRDPAVNACHKSNMANGTIDIPFNTGPEHLSIADSE